jgi:hypothetical protein
MRLRAAARRRNQACRDVGELVYELLDAHADTADLAADLGPDPRWTAHLDYLRALQRAGREALAQMSSHDPA